MYSPLDDPRAVASAYSRGHAPFAEAPLRGIRTADVAIVGGGLTGLSAALEIAKAGKAVAVIEARHVASGGSGRAFGQVVPYAKHGPDRILRHFGQDPGTRLVAALASGPDIVFGLIREHGIECEALHNGLVFAPHSRANERPLLARAHYWQKRGVPVEVLTGAALADVTGTDYYPLAILEPRGGTINPYAYTLGLARAATAAGASIYSRSRATAVEKSGGGWRVVTDGGEVRAGHVVLCSGAYTDGLWSGLNRSVVPMRAHIAISKPLPAQIADSILPGGRSLTDTRRLYSGIRIRPGGRLQMSTDGPAFGRTEAPALRKAERRARALYPAIGELAWEESWSGWVDMSADFFPHVHELSDGVWAVIGLSGRGLAFGTLLGKDIALRLSGRAAEAVMPATPLRSISVHRIAAPLVSSLMHAYRALDRVGLASYARPAGRKETTA